MRPLKAAALTAVLVAAFFMTACAAPAPPADATARAGAVRAATVVVVSGQRRGAGVLIAPHLVLTARHVAVMEEAEVYAAVGPPAVGVVAWRAEGADLAVIELAAPLPGRPARLDCAPPALGTPVVSMGHPLTGYLWLLRRGVVAADGPGQDGTVALDLQTYAGQSGAGVFDPKGALIGIVDGAYRLPRLPGLDLPIGLGSMVPGPVICAALGGYAPARGLLPPAPKPEQLDAFDSGARP